MSQAHLDRLTALDASFLHQENDHTHMHVGGILILAGKPPTIEALREHILSRLHLVPRYRQKLATPPFQTGRPLWIDDPNFNIDFHVRHTALPKPGNDNQLLNLTARAYSQQLDRSKPLWELYLVQGLSGNRFALLSKTHHSLVDGVSGVDLATVLFDISPTQAVAEVRKDPWQPQVEPSPAELITAGIKGVIKASVKAASKFVTAATQPEVAISEAREAVEGVGELIWAGVNPAPDTPLNVKIGPHRRVAFTKATLAEFKLIKDSLGGTVNDVVLAVVSGALTRFLKSRGVRTEGLELRALVPVSIRTEAQHHELGNRIAAMRSPLPVYIDDPIARLKRVRESMDGLKESKQAIGAEVLASVENMAPPTILAQASRINFSTRLFNLLVTNVPGPQFPLYLMGNELLELMPVAFLPKNHALAVAIMSYNGKVQFGLLGDYDALPDLDDIATYIDDALNEYLELAKAKKAKQAARAKAKAKPTATKKS